jgi:hypothetical protein
MVADIRANHKHIKLFGVWHALFGYWGGINPKGYIAENYKTRRVRTAYLGQQPCDMLIVDPADVERFYDDFYSWLRSQGVDFVKTDVQHMLSMLEDAKDREEVTTSYQRAWTVAICKHFQGKVCGLKPARLRCSNYFGRTDQRDRPFLACPRRHKRCSTVCCRTRLPLSAIGIPTTSSRPSQIAIHGISLSTPTMRCWTAILTWYRIGTCSRQVRFPHHLTVNSSMRVT